jgi:hypothetical protein
MGFFLNCSIWRFSALRCASYISTCVMIWHGGPRNSFRIVFPSSLGKEVRTSSRKRGCTNI